MGGRGGFRLRCIVQVRRRKIEPRVKQCSEANQTEGMRSDTQCVSASLKSHFRFVLISQYLFFS